MLCIHVPDTSQRYPISLIPHPSQMAFFKCTFSGIGVGNVGLWVLINDQESFRKCIRERGHINQFRQVLGGLERSFLEMARAQIKVGDHPRVLKRSRAPMRFCESSRNVCHREWRWLPAQLIHTRTICTQGWFDTGAQYADGGWTSPIWGLDLWRPPIWGLEAQKDEGIDQKGSLLLPPEGPVARLQGSIARSFSNDYQSCLMKSYHFPLTCFRCTLVAVHEGFGSFHQWASDCHFRIWVWFQTLFDTSECSWPKRDFNIALLLYLVCTLLNEN